MVSRRSKFFFNRNFFSNRKIHLYFVEKIIWFEMVDLIHLLRNCVGGYSRMNIMCFLEKCISTQIFLCFLERKKRKENAMFYRWNSKIVGFFVQIIASMVIFSIALNSNEMNINEEYFCEKDIHFHLSTTDLMRCCWIYWKWFLDKKSAIVFIFVLIFSHYFS